MKRVPVIAANWKMNLSIKEAENLAKELWENAKDIDDREIIVFPSFLQIPAAAGILKNTNIGIGGQNLYFEENGAFTGEISAFQLKDAGCTHVLIGHSERRHYFKEDYETVNKKIKRALSSDLKVMLCVGESLEEHENGLTEMVVVDELESAFKNVNMNYLENMYIAYEPIWAIGTGKTATPKDASHVHNIIRKTLNRIFGQKAALEMRILYGGSVKPDNIVSLMKQDDIDGALVGGASLEAKSFISLIHFDK
ncbi:MAG: triose-phosphate isomerase [Spirochaetia bacterium]|nr:triose-phosphate isomerase [Spirochaetia bacterium]